MLHIESENFQPRADYVFVAADPNKNSIKKFAHGLQIVVDTRFNPHNRGNVTQDGIVRFAPLKLTSKLPVELKKGDHIYFQHFWCDEENKVSVNNEFLYHGNYESCYCKVVDGKIIMLSDFNLIEPIQEDIKESAIITPDSAKKISSKKGIARHLNIRLKEQGIVEGDVVMFQKNADYDIDVEGKKYFVIDNKYIVAKVLK